MPQIKTIEFLKNQSTNPSQRTPVYEPIPPHIVRYSLDLFLFSVMVSSILAQTLPYLSEITEHPAWW